MSVKIKNIPDNILTAVDSLIRPYGVDIFDLLLNISSTDSSLSEISKKYFTISEAEQYSSLSRWSLFRAAKAGRINTCKISPAKSGKILIDKESLDKWLESCIVPNSTYIPPNEGINTRSR